jgi:hypothetical protein
MALNCSTGFRDRILGPSSFESIFHRGCIEVRNGPQPASADAPASGVLLGRITAGGGPWAHGGGTNGLLFVKTGAIVVNDPLQEWRLTGEVTGTARWFRLVANPFDPGGQSITHPRIDGAIGLLDAVGDYQMLLPLVTISATTSIVIPSFLFALPPLTFN